MNSLYQTLVIVAGTVGLSLAGCAVDTNKRVQDSEGKMSATSADALATSNEKLEHASTVDFGPPATGDASLDLQTYNVQGHPNACIVAMLTGWGGAPVPGCPLQPAYSGALLADEQSNGWYGFFDNTYQAAAQGCAVRAAQWSAFCVGPQGVAVFWFTPSPGAAPFIGAADGVGRRWQFVPGGAVPMP